MVNIIIAILAIAVVSGSIYSLITGEYGIQPYMQVLSGLMVFALGLKVLQKNRAIAVFCFLASGFSIFIGVYILLN